MAGIEKVDELTGEYRGYIMYDHKRSHIQVFSWNRKHFRGASHTLYILKPEARLVHKYGGSMDYSREDYKDGWTPPFTCEAEYLAYRKRLYHERLLSEYPFILHMPELPGEVRGYYLNYTFDLLTTKRRLKRMLRCRRLNVVKLDMSVDEFYDSLERTQ